MDHQNYAHYGAFHHVNLQSLRKEDEERFNELKERGSGASLSGWSSEIQIRFFLDQHFHVVKILCGKS